MKQLVITLIICICQYNFAQDTLYHSDIFTITDNAVYEGNYEAIALLPTEIKTNYESAFRPGVKRVLKFKFSINGFDNERPLSQDHLVEINPENGKFITPVFKYGESDPVEIETPDKDEIYLENTYEVKVTFRLDMRKVFKEMNSAGFYQTYDGSIIRPENFEGVYIAGEEYPLTWNFDALAGNNEFKLTDADNDSIYEIDIQFKVNPDRPIDKSGYSHWKLTKDISNYPRFTSTIPLFNSIHNLALEELVMNIRSDSTFMAGAKWPGVWTRDISYSIFLSLAYLNPEIAKRSLKAKVKNDRIIQDTGTGGSYPVSTDRMTWAIAAWEIYKVTGDKEWLKYSYRIIQKSAAVDMLSIIDDETGLFYGESSFLDWRQQSYPKWMDPKDIYTSLNLGTNVVHYQTYQILSQMSKLIGDTTFNYTKVSESVKNAINTNFWMAEKGYYGQYLYGRNYKTLSQRSESLGEALAVLFHVARKNQRNKIIANTPVLDYGISCFFPQISEIPSYHNNGIWPFVQSFWTWAAAKEKNEKAVSHGFASIFRASSLFLTNKENFVASSGKYIGTEINSDRQLWSVAGNLALFYRILFGLTFETDGIYFSPFIPQLFNGTYQLNNFKYKQANISVTVEGYGASIDSFFVNNQYSDLPFLSDNLVGDYSIRIKLSNSSPLSSINLVQNHFTPNIENFEWDGDELSWDEPADDLVYFVLKNGKVYQISNDSEMEIPPHLKSVEFQVMAVDAKGYSSFLTEPIWIQKEDEYLIFQPDDQINKIHSAYEGYSSDGYIPLTVQKNLVVSFPVQIEKAGIYSLDFRYANGNGPINTDNKCAIRTLRIDSINIATIVLPQRGLHQWTDWGYSNSEKVYLTAGEHLIELNYYNHNQNMNMDENVAFIDHLRLRYLNQE